MKNKRLLLVLIPLICVTAFAANWVIDTVFPQIGDDDAALQRRSAKSLAELHNALLGKGTNTVSVSIGGATNSALEVTNVTFGRLDTATQHSTNVLGGLTDVAKDINWLYNNSAGSVSVMNALKTLMIAVGDRNGTNWPSSGTETNVSLSGWLRGVFQQQVAISNQLNILTNKLTILQTEIDSAYNSNNVAARTNHFRTLNHIAISNTVPTAVLSGSGVAAWADEYGRQVMKGTDLTSDSIKANVINQPEDQFLGGDGALMPLVSVTNTQSSVWYDVSGYKYFTYFICPTAATNTGITCEVSPNSGTNWVQIYTNNITSTNNVCVSFGPVAHKYMRWTYTGTNEACSINAFFKK